MGGAFKQMRYRVYTLESRLLGYQRHQVLLRSPISRYCPSETLFAVVEAPLQGGLTLVQYRDKTADDGVQLTQTKQLSNLAINTVPFSLSTTSRSSLGSGC